MSAPKEIQNLTEGVVSSYDAGIAAVGQLIEKGLDLLDGYRKEQEAIRGALREKLASVGSLRRKDFDEVIGRVLNFQSERELEIKRLIREFLSRQKELVGRLKRSLEAGIFQEVDRCKRELSHMIEQARDEILSFQQEQGRIREALASLMGRKELVSVREFKAVIQDLEGKLYGPNEKQQAMGNG